MMMALSVEKVALTLQPERAVLVLGGLQQQLVVQYMLKAEPFAHDMCAPDDTFPGPVYAGVYATK